MASRVKVDLFQLLSSKRVNDLWKVKKKQSRKKMSNLLAKSDTVWFLLLFGNETNTFENKIT